MGLQVSEGSEDEETFFRPGQRKGRNMRDGRCQREIGYQNPVFRRGRNGGEDYFEGRLESAQYKGDGRREIFQQDFKMKVDLPNFSGKLDIEAFIDWVKNVESFFEYIETAEDKKVKMVALKLKSGASTWWDQIQVNRRLIGKTLIRSWPRMLKMMKERFLPTDFEQILYQQYQQCRQDNRKVAEYAKEFHHLSARTQTNESENYQIGRFVDGLKENIHEQLDLQPIATLPATISMVFKAELKLEKRQKNSGTKKNQWEKAFIPYQRKNYDNTKQAQGSGTSKAKEGQPSKTNQSPRTQELSTKNSSTNYPRPNLGFCYRRNQNGHLSNQCPQRKTVAYVEEGGSQ